MENNLPLFERIVEYRVDFAYSYKAYFNAYERLEKSKNRIDKIVKGLSFLSIILPIIAVSTIMIYLSEKTPKDEFLYISSVLGLLPIFITIYLLLIPAPKDITSYLNRAEDYLLLYKNAKNFEALQKEENIANETIRKKLEYYEIEMSKIVKIPLLLEKEDYEKASAQIKNGEIKYDPKDKENT